MPVDLESMLIISKSYPGVIEYNILEKHSIVSEKYLFDTLRKLEQRMNKK
jgi:hypothetical protein